ncbi:MAG: hypothetical protein R6V01_01165 [Thermoplasmatota archaeon]
MARKKKTTIDAEDLYKIDIVNGCQISPDGSKVAYSLQRVDRDKEKKYTNIWLALVPPPHGTLNSENVFLVHTSIMRLDKGGI